jgi:hypothetical protein
MQRRRKAPAVSRTDPQNGGAARPRRLLAGRNRRQERRQLSQGACGFPTSQESRGIGKTRRGHLERAPFGQHRSAAHIVHDLAERRGWPISQTHTSDLEKKSELQGLSYKTPQEELAEKFHMSQDLLRRLNPHARGNRSSSPMSTQWRCTTVAIPSKRRRRRSRNVRTPASPPLWCRRQHGMCAPMIRTASCSASIPPPSVVIGAHIP